uniref:Peroxisomal biogenesis factor 19 n=1 Tax=Neogobius melanostomus TaxID=47308 RepID=A0A8C6STA9_9GOBI
YFSGALDDFDKAAAPPPAAEAAAPSDASGAEKPPLLEDCKLFETLFEGEMANQAREEWEKAMSELAQQEPDLLEHFQKLSEAAGKVGGYGWRRPGQSSGGFGKYSSHNAIFHAESTVQRSAVPLPQGDHHEGMQLYSTLIVPEGKSVKDTGLCKALALNRSAKIRALIIVSLCQYPEWLEVNKPTLSSEDFQRYEKQAKIMGKSANCSRERRREPRRKRAPSRPSWTSCRRCIYRNTAILGSCHEFYITHGSVLFSALCKFQKQANRMG